MTTPSEPLPNDLASAHAMILAQRALLEQERSALIIAQSEVKVRALEIERLKLLLAKARREQFGQSSERSKLLVEQLDQVSYIFVAKSRGGGWRPVRRASTQELADFTVRRL